MGDTGKLVAAGVLTSGITAYIVVLIDGLFGFNIYSVSFWFILPVGAIICGLAAASGYYFASKKFHILPTLNLLIQMIAVSIWANILIYWLAFHGAFIASDPPSNFINFSQYVDISITQSRYSMHAIGGLNIEGGAVGSSGYIFAFIEVVGFAIGAVAVFSRLEESPRCPRCSRYLKSEVLKKDQFESAEDCLIYMNDLFAKPFEDENFAAAFSRSHKVSWNARKQGWVRLESGRLNCSACDTQWLFENAIECRQSQQQTLPELCRCSAVPANVDLLRIAHLGA